MNIKVITLTAIFVCIFLFTYGFHCNNEKISSTKASKSKKFFVPELNGSGVKQNLFSRNLILSINSSKNTKFWHINYEQCGRYTIQVVAGKFKGYYLSFDERQTQQTIGSFVVVKALILTKFKLCSSFWKITPRNANEWLLQPTGGDNFANFYLDFDNSAEKINTGEELISRNVLLSQTQTAGSVWVFNKVFGNNNYYTLKVTTGSFNNWFLDHLEDDPRSPYPTTV